MEVARELEEEYMATLVTLPTKVPALHEKKKQTSDQHCWRKCFRGEDCRSRRAELCS
jgi:hypothetical protein